MPDITEGQKLLDFAASKARQLGYLKARWADERKYEDFAEYVKAFKQDFEGSGYEVVSLSKGFRAVILVTATQNKYELTVGMTKFSLVPKKG